ncbi:Y-family DNA polymerase [Nitrosospira sp. Nsp13]|uniref:Y-family DNA polymerase n=1 Tax=Nitrosospira sp. Nsp13 TaxID=1855332 RepID=UPI00088C08FA|nr:Y-family DNA polymerase [Nitrosospira sp. Nsp13]SCX88956.1 DNA polymerase V [Nitrosospira sp. Nsp13]
MSSTKPNRPVFALCDANSFYASCEKVFRPDLRTAPVVVLSNNDGCVIAQSREAKVLGIKMAGPWFEVEERAREIGVVEFSSNYELYANMSNRFMATLRQFSPRQEVYSIDECFLDLTGMKLDLVAYGHTIRETVMRWTGLPICVGVGHSKTLAKLANYYAKKEPETKGVCDFSQLSQDELNSILEILPVSSVWGVGRRLEASLKAVGVENVLRLKNANLRRIRDRFGITMQRTVQELNGEAWLELEEETPMAKQVMSSRSFGERVESLPQLREAISYHAANVAQRLRRQGLYARAVSIFIQNSPFDQAKFYGRSETIALPAPTDCSFQITNAALWILKKMYRPQVYYQKAGVMLSELVLETGQQIDLLGFSSTHNKSGRLMETVDTINRRYKRSTIHLASEGTVHTWSMRRSFKSQNYTGDWKELPVVS